MTLGNDRGWSGIAAKTEATVRKHLIGTGMVRGSTESICL